MENLHVPSWGKGTARAMFQYLAKRFNLKDFYETGTGFGDTLAFMAFAFEQCYSIELDRWKYELALEMFRYAKTVHLYHGNSRDILLELLRTDVTTRKALFFLDAHGEVGSADGPLADEIHAIQNYRPDSLIAIDDVGNNTHHDQNLHGIDLQGWSKIYKFDRIMFVHNGSYDLGGIR